MWTYSSSTFFEQSVWPHTENFLFVYWIHSAVLFPVMSSLLVLVFYFYFPWQPCCFSLFIFLFLPALVFSSFLFFQVLRAIRGRLLARWGKPDARVESCLLNEDEVEGYLLDENSIVGVGGCLPDEDWCRTGHSRIVTRWGQHRQSTLLMVVKWSPTDSLLFC